jgi:pseudouridine kinase
VKDKIVICIGGALIDESFRCLDVPVKGSSNPSHYYRSAGGVSRNIAHHLARLGHSVELITHLGNDPDGKWLSDQCTGAGMGISHSMYNDVPTGKYTAILSPDGDLFIGVVATHFENTITPSFLRQKLPVLKSASLVQLDCNLNEECLNCCINFCRSENIPCVIDPVSVAKAQRLKEINIDGVLLLTPNLEELSVMAHSKPEIESLVNETLTRGVQHLWVREGKSGSTIYREGRTFTYRQDSFTITDATGAGDAALSGWIHAYLSGRNVQDCLEYGHALTRIILQTRGAVHDSLNKEMLDREFLSGHIHQT